MVCRHWAMVGKTGPLQPRSMSCGLCLHCSQTLGWRRQARKSSSVTKSEYNIRIHEVANGSSFLVGGPWSMAHLQGCMVDSWSMVNVLSMVQKEDGTMWKLNRNSFFGRWSMVHGPSTGAWLIHGPWSMFSPWSMTRMARCGG